MGSEFYDTIGRTLGKENLKDAFGWHLLIDARGCDKSTVNSEDTIKSFLKVIVNKLDMIPVGESTCYYFDDGNGRGVSGIQLITTSHISCHTDNEGGNAYIDIFSCNTYSQKLKNIALACIKDYFNPQELYHIIVMRLPAKITDEVGNVRMEDIR